ncbi:ATP-binding protein [Candidatus Parcubacteria bacterium]|nr:ATP-binding protein [Candidatus Parcubacteria bacterium]
MHYIDEYLKIGGFPEIVVKNLDAKSYLETLFDALLLKDVIKRYKVRFSQKIYSLASYLISNFSSESSYNKLRNILEFRSSHTVQQYMKYLEEAYVFFFLNRFSFKLKEQIKSPRKIYLSDNGWILAKTFASSSNIGRLMENTVFVQLIKKGHKFNQDIFYYQTKNKREVDFVLKQNLKIKELIQVCYDVNETKTKEREVKALIEASQELRCNKLLIITYDFETEEKVKNKKIKFVPLWKWLLE